MDDNTGFSVGTGFPGNSGLGDAVRLLAYRSYFREPADFDLALAKVGFALRPGGQVTSATVAGPTGELSDEEEHVVVKPVDGWESPEADPWEPGQPQEQAMIGTQAGTGAERPQANDTLPVEAVEIYGADWRPVPAAPAPSPALLAGKRRDQAGRQGSGGAIRRQPFVIPHILASVPAQGPAPAALAYQPVARWQRHRGPVGGLGPVNEATWRVAVDSLSATSPTARRRSIDIEACVNALARWQPIGRLPLRERSGGRAATTTLMRDVALANGPLGADVTGFVTCVQANVREELEILGFSRTPGRLGCGAGPIWTWRPLDLATLGQRVIAVSNVPPHAHRQRQEWQSLADALIASGRRFAFVNVGEAAGARAPGSDQAQPPGSWLTLVC
jgi:hypothetical protein